MKPMLMILLALFPGIAFGQAGMAIHYSFYENITYDSVNHAIVSSLVTQGNTTFSSGCITCYGARHTAQGTHQIKDSTGKTIAGGSYYGESVQPPSQQINYTNTLDDPCPGDVCGPVSIDGEPEVLCSAVGSIAAALFLFQVEAAVTLVKMSPVQVPPEGTCFVNRAGILQCQYSTFDWCTPATTPPDFEVTGVNGVGLATYPTYWTGYAACERPGPGFKWLCTPGITTGGIKGPDTFPKFPCTKHP